MSQTGCRDLIHATISATASGATSCGSTVSAPRRASVSAIRRPATAVMFAATSGTVAPEASARGEVDVEPGGHRRAAGDEEHVVVGEVVVGVLAVEEAHGRRTLRA